jgi:hypothetical protein
LRGIIHFTRGKKGFWGELEKKIISDNKPLRGGNLLLPHLNVQVQDDSK